MIEKRLFLQPGDAVRVTHDRGEFIADRPDDTYLIATKGSIGTVVSYEDYRTYYQQRLRPYGIKNLEAYEGYLSAVKEAMDKQFRYPIRFEKVMPASTPDTGTDTRVGEIELLDVYVLEKINCIGEEATFIIDKMRVIFSDGDLRPQPWSGHKLLLIDFTIECQSINGIRISPSSRAWLRYSGLDDFSTDVMSIAQPPLKIELPERELSKDSRLSGYVTFQVPEYTCAYEFNLEIAALGIGKSIFKIPCLRPGDTVSLKNNSVVHFHDPFRSKDLSPDSLHLIFPLGTEGSLGTIVTFAEYRTGYEQRLKQWHRTKRSTSEQFEAYESIMLQVKEEIETCVKYPVRLVKALAPSVDPELLFRRFAFREYGFCEEGEIYLIEASELKKM